MEKANEYFQKCDVLHDNVTDLYEASADGNKAEAKKLIAEIRANLNAFEQSLDN